MSAGILRRTFLLLLFPFCLFAEKAQDPLRVGMELAYPPFEMTDAAGAPDGVSVAIAEALGEFLDRPVEIRNIPFQGLIPALRTGKIDLILSSMTQTEERARAIDFSDPYLTTGLTLLVGKDSGIESIDDVGDGSVVAVKQGTTGHLYAMRNLPRSRVLVLDKESAAVLEVVQGKADAFIYDQMSTFKHWQRNPDSTRALLDPFRKEYWAIGVKKGNQSLLDSVNTFLAEFRASGGFDDLGDRYLSEQKEAFAELGYPFVF
ncbi:transporter substrate-binding domain-containing protein [Puniceicoccus vermicola]|uniref:Transporter substrate-binding domain-containing protein n=1 Tax=Puniceicoccus vermicola TaxID=388746 RepID=A0A7X1E4I4_9BACT|nr:transporter substrate-binding domain-containing protein [Puniceicoccus vermicola]MBC2602028.1 transporter substrate-binding domain-containing protein [Puniceicoccus vermicola]